MGTGLKVPEALARDGGDLDAYIGEIRLFAGQFVPKGWLPCRGGALDRDKYDDLSRAIGDAFTAGGGGRHLPDLRGRALLGTGQPPDGHGKPVGGNGDGLCGRAANDDPGTLGLTMLISPHRQYGDPLIGEVRPFALGFAPKGWYVCDGSTVRLGNEVRLFAAIDTTFGGNGRDSFELPDLRGFTPIGAGDGPGVPETRVGSRTRGLAPNGAGDPRPPRLHFNYCIAARGDFPQREG